MNCSITVRVFLAFIVTLLCACAIPALAQSPPLEIKGVLFGSTTDELMAKFPEARCSASSCMIFPSDRAEKQCGSIADAVRRKTETSTMECRSNAIKELNFGPAPAALYTLTFRNGRLANATVIFSESAHATLVIALTEKYGKPTSDKSVPIQNRAGATFANRIVVWDLPEGRIEARQRGSTVDKGNVTMSTAEYLKETSREIIDNAKAAAKGL